MRQLLRKISGAAMVGVFVASLLYLVLVGQALSASCGYPNGPKSGTMKADVNEWKTCNTMASLSPPGEFWMELSNMQTGSVLTNTVYGSYCVDLTGTILDNPQQGNIVYTVDFWSSLDPNLPASVKKVSDGAVIYTIPWDKINYLLNAYPNESWLNLQAAYWDLVHGCTQSPGSLYTCSTLRPAPYYFPYGPSAPYGCQSQPLVDESRVSFLVNEANNNGVGFVPKAGERIASVGQVTNCSPTTICNQHLPYQVFFIPTTCPTCTGSAGDTVWMDKNGDGYQDATEPGIAGVAVKLTGTDTYGQAINLTQNTDANGNYMFSNLCAGNYKVTVADPTGFNKTVIASADGNDNIQHDSNDPAGTTFKPETDAIVNNSIDFGYVPVCSGSIGDKVWKDFDANGLQEGGDLGIAGVELTLTGTDVYLSHVSKTATTNANGIYSFDGLCQGNYTVAVTSGIPAGYYPSPPLNPSADSRVPNDGNDPAGTTVTLVDNGDSNDSVDFGYKNDCQGTIGNFVWKDLNENGLLDSGEPGIANVKIMLGGTNAYGKLVSMTEYTDANGYYQFSGLCQSGVNGYAVTVDSTTVTPGWIPTAPLNPDGDILNDTDSNDPKGTVVHLGSDNVANPTIDFGYINGCKSTIGDFVWEDKNGNGAKDDLNSGIFGVEVQLTGTNIYGQSVNISSITNPTGYYLFSGLCKGTYTVSVNAGSTDYLGLAPVAPVSSNGNDGNETDSNNPAGTAVEVVADNAGSNLSVDFGYFKPGSIGDRVWLDANNNGIQDAGETGLNGWTVTLTKPDSTTATFTTAGDGNYIFGNLAPGSYKVCTTPMTDYMQTYDLDGLATPNCAIVTLSSGDNHTDVDFGYFLPTPSVSIKKLTNGVDAPIATGPVIAVDSAVSWSYIVTNTGNVELTGLLVTDDKGVSVACPATFLATGAAMTCTASGTAAAGQYENTGTVIGYGAGKIVSASYMSHYFGAAPAIYIEKQVKGPDSRTFISGTNVSFAITVKNTGNVTLSNVIVTDPLVPSCSMTIGVLAAGETKSYTCTTNNVTAGLTNIATVTGSYDNTTVSDKDESTVVINAAPSANCVFIEAVKGVAITPVTMTASGGMGAPYTFSATGLPAGLTMSTSGTISGTPTVSGTFNYTVTITDKDGNVGTVSCSVAVNVPVMPGIEVKKFVSIDGINWIHTDSAPGIQLLMCSDGTNDVCEDDSEKKRCDYNNSGKCDENDITYCKFNRAACDQHDRDYDKREHDHADYNRDGKCDEKDIYYCKYNKSTCDDRDREYGSKRRHYRSDDSQNKEACDAKIKDEQEREHADYNRDGRVNEYDISYCKSNKGSCDTHDKKFCSTKRVFRCDDSNYKTTCSTNANNESNRDQSDYNRDGKCDEKDIDYCKTHSDECNKRDRKFGIEKHVYRCDDSSDKTTCASRQKWEEQIDRDHSDYNHDGRCDEKDMDYCASNKYDCDRHDRYYGATKRRQRCDDSSSKATCEARARDHIDYDNYVPPATCNAVYFKFIETNIGNVALSNVTLTDNVYSLSSCSIQTTLEPGASNSCQIGPLPAQAGQHTNIATASGTYGGTVYQATDKAYYFGYYKLPVAVCNGSIGDFVWKDANKNGVQDFGEAGLAGVTVTLKNNATYATVTTKSDAYGKYGFSGLCDGSYTITVTIPTGYQASPSYSGSDPTKDSNGISSIVVMDSSKTSNYKSIDFGFYIGSTSVTWCGSGQTWGHSDDSWGGSGQTWGYSDD